MTDAITISRSHPNVTSAPIEDDKPEANAVPQELSGYLVFGVFIAAALLVTGLIAVIAWVNTWWMLGLIYGAYVLVTGLVTFVVFKTVSDRRLTGSGGAPTPA